MRRNTILLATILGSAVRLGCATPPSYVQTANEDDHGARALARDCLDLSSTKCQLHDTPLIETQVPIENGLPENYSLEVWQAERAFFPNSCRSVSGSGMPGETETVGVKYCAACRAVEEVWRASRDTLRWGPPAERSCFQLSPGVCELHGTVLEEGEVEIVYGLLDFPGLEFVRAERTLFPNACDWSAGGCVVQEESKDLVRYCPKCRAAKSEWRRQNPNPR